MDLDYQIKLDVVQSGFTPTHCWVHPKAGAIPGNPPVVVMTMQKLLLSGSDIFDPLQTLRTFDMGITWDGPGTDPAFDMRHEQDGVRVGVCDFTPAWHAASQSLLGIGHTVRYIGNEIKPYRTRETAYSVYDLNSNTWSPWDIVQMPTDDKFTNAGAGCSQRYDLENGDILIPIYFMDSKTNDPRSFTVMRCSFDGQNLKYIEHGSEHKLNKNRGYLEPSLTRYKDYFYLTLRADEYAYVCKSKDGLHFDEPQLWRWDDGSILPTYNTQQHWVTHSEGLYLVYTRIAENNHHVFRHRAPLFIAQVDPESLTVIKDTERILVPERGARLGNFQVVNVTQNETWVTVSEWMQPIGCEKYGSDNSIFVSRIIWSKPNKLL
jgi:hypothetical protein